MGKNISLTGAGPGVSILSGAGLSSDGKPILRVDQLGNDTRIKGFTFEDNTIADTRYTYGGAIMCDYEGSPTIEGNVFQGNTAEDGAGICVAGTSGLPVIRNNIFKSNSASFGGGIEVIFADGAIIENNYFHDNDSHGFNQGIGTGGAIRVEYCFETTFVTGNVCFANRAGYAGGLAVEGGTVVATGNTFAFNEGNVGFAPSGVRIYGAHGDTLIAERNIIANGIGNAAFQVVGAPIGVPYVRLDCNNFWQNQGPDFHTFAATVSHGPNDFSADPLFCNPAAGILTLAAGSPCLPENSPTCGLVGALGLDCAAVAGVEEVTNGPSLSMLRVVSHTGGTIEFRMDAGANAPSGLARLDIFDLQGHRILSTGMNLESGRGITRWDGRDDAGRILSTGVYFARVNFDGTSDRASFVLVR